jgi:para-nitrobenzyl esterase
MREAQLDEVAGGHPYSAREIANRLLVADGSAPDRAAAAEKQDGMTKAELRGYLYSKTPEDIFALWGGSGFGMINTPDNFGDGHVLPALDTAAIFSNRDNHNPVPVILGTNRDEPALFMAQDPSHVTRFLWVFPRLKDEDAYLRTVRYGALAWKARGVDELAEHMTAAGNPNVFAYRFDWDELGSRAGYDLGKALGAAHALEIPFVFGDFANFFLAYLYQGDDAERDQLSDRMMSYWAQFAYTGDPGQGRDGDLPRWLPWGTDGQRSILFDSESGGGVRMMDELVTRDRVVELLANDPDIPSQRDRCLLYLSTFRWGSQFDQAEYEALGAEGCKAYPPESLLGG